MTRDEYRESVRQAAENLFEKYPDGPYGAFDESLSEEIDGHFVYTNEYHAVLSYTKNEDALFAASDLSHANSYNDAMSMMADAAFMADIREAYEALVVLAGDDEEEDEEDEDDEGEDGGVHESDHD